MIFLIFSSPFVKTGQTGRSPIHGFSPSTETSCVTGTDFIFSAKTEHPQYPLSGRQIYPFVVDRAGRLRREMIVQATLSCGLRRSVKPRQDLAADDFIDRSHPDVQASAARS